MDIKAIICDLDGSLMIPSSGLYVSKEVKEKLVEIQEKGIIVILNSARALKGVEPLSKQIKMDKFGGYIVSCNGANVKDTRDGSTIIEYDIDENICLEIWNFCLENNLVPGFLQPEYAVSAEMTKGYRLDKKNCCIDYIVTNNPEKYIKDKIWKISISGDKSIIDRKFTFVKQYIESNYDLTIVRSTDDYIDVMSKKVSKLNTCSELLDKIDISWDNTSCIGDGISDIECIKASKLGVSLENANPNVKVIADMVVPSCFLDGCLEWLNYLIK